MDEIFNIQSKFVERDYMCPQKEYEMLEYTWKKAQKVLLKDFKKFKECCIDDRFNHVAFNKLIEKYEKSPKKNGQKSKDSV